MLYTLNFIKETVTNAAKANNIGRVYLFGSYARNEANENSDVDLRVEDIGKGFFTIGGFYADLEDAFGKVDILTVKTGEYSEFWENIRREEILLYEK